jgi:hypothetical protein
MLEGNRAFSVRIGSRKKLVVLASNTRSNDSIRSGVALAMRVISAALAPASFAVSCQVAVTLATSLMIARAVGNLKPKYSAASSRRSIEQVPSSRLMFVVRTRALTLAAFRGANHN